ncbi:MAG: aspartyl-phosphate phosphatase Spo0E family protein [Desulfitobacteriaceae bacterium]|nr:aspartyl-phosphate phosphatase Spo0E family protein [Desulfitobacteriaceae bacterium]MDI6913469.1 aspartyl-phosphate phosphatase Spo0E family protein [Desulfitobacteriaceae bacterium]
MESELLESIEALRREMSDVAMDKGFHDPAVLVLSQKLDVLINQFYALRSGLAEYAA